MKKLLLILLLIFIGIISVWMLSAEFYRIKPTKQISVEYHDTLVKLALLSLPTLDVPVSSILIYNGKIIGSGYNTVIRNSKIGEHAEMNALSSAIQSLGFEKFKNLNRDSLLLITTFEPCLMCTGAIIEYNIKHVLIEKEKTFKHHLKEEWNKLNYEFMRTKIVAGNLQDSLFKLHPHYGIQEK